VIQVGKVDEPLAAAIDQELLGVVLQRRLNIQLAQLRHHQLREFVAAGRAEEKIEPGHAEPLRERDAS